MTKDDGTTQLPREVVSIDTTAETGQLHVKFSGTLSSSSNTTIRIWYNGTDTEPAASSTYGSENVWGSDYFARYSMGEASGTVLDSTSNDVDSTDETGVTYGATGEIGDAIDFGDHETGTTERLIFGSAPVDATAITFSNWVNPSALPGNEHHVIHLGADIEGDRYDTWYDVQGDGSIRFSLRNQAGTRVIVTSSGTISTSTWSLVHCTWDGSTMRVYINGSVDTNTGSHSGTMENESGFLYGKLPGQDVHDFAGLIDESRVLTSALSANWITTEYNNQNSPSTFYNTSDEQTSVTTQTKTHTLDSTLLNTKEQTHTLDTTLVNTKEQTHTLDTTLQETQTATHTLDTFVTDNPRETHTLDTTLKATNTKTHTLDSVANTTSTETYTLDSFVFTQNTKTHTLDTTLFKKQTDTHTLDTTVNATNEKTHTIDSTLGRTQTVTCTIDTDIAGWVYKSKVTSTSWTYKDKNDF